MQVSLWGLKFTLEHLRKQWNVKYTYALDMKELSFGPSKLDYFPVPWCNLPAKYMLSVDCSGNLIKEIPDEISRLTELQVFNASNNKLVTLPPSFGKLYKLQDLILNNNRLLFLPTEMTSLRELRTMDVEDNYIGDVPHCGKMVEVPGKIQYLLAMVEGRQTGVVTMTSLELTAIPDDVFEWPGKKISASPSRHNKLVDTGSGVPIEAAGFTKIVELCLNDNLMYELDGKVSLLEDLRIMTIRRNHIVHPCHELEKMPVLEELDLSENDIREFPEDMKFPPTLKVLKLSFNKIRVLPKVLMYLEHLEILHADSNSLQLIPEELSACTALTEMILAKNFFEELPRALAALHNMRTLDISCNQLITIPSQIGGMSSMTRLNLHENQLIFFPPSIGWMVNLQELTMANNGIHVLPRSVCKLYDLLSLDFSYNAMTKLLPYIGNFTRMKELRLSFNEIVELPVQVTQCLAPLIFIILSIHVFILQLLTEMSIAGGKIAQPDYTQAGSQSNRVCPSINREAK